MASFDVTEASKQFNVDLTEERSSRLVALHANYWDNKESAETFKALFSLEGGSLTIEDPVSAEQFKFFIRQEHVKLHNLLEQSSKNTSNKHKLAGAFIGGQPGTGIKSVSTINITVR